MNVRRFVSGLSAVALIFAGAHYNSMFAAADATGDIAAADAQILAQVREHSELMPNLEYLSDNIGPRLTGSAQLKQANDWTADLFRKYGLSNVHLEPWTIAHSWTRGTASARIIAPTEHPLTIASAGWSPSTLGVVRGPVVYVDAKKKEELEKFRGKLKGAVVVYQEPESLSPPPVVDPNAVRPMQAPPSWPGQPPVPSPSAALTEFGRARTAFFQQEGVGAVLRDSGKPHGLLNMTGIGGEKFEIGAVPTAFITGEGYRMIFRMMKHGPVQLEISMTNTFSDKTGGGIQHRCRNPRKRKARRSGDSGRAFGFLGLGDGIDGQRHRFHGSDGSCAGVSEKWIAAEAHDSLYFVSAEKKKVCAAR